jgi:hypothetical protein
MHQLFRRLDADPNVSYEQKTMTLNFSAGYCWRRCSRIFFNRFDLLIDKAAALDKTPKRCSCVGWQRDSLRRNLLQRLAIHVRNHAGNEPVQLDSFQ